MQTPLNLCCDFGDNKPLQQLVGQAVKFKLALAGPALLGRVGRRNGRASINTGRSRVGGSRCGPRQARLWKTCYHSCDTDSA